jgi:myo-inositol-1-phosphate synthase
VSLSSCLSQSSYVLDFILQPDLYPDLYKDIYHKVRINYYPPRADNKEGWDNIYIFGLRGLITTAA